MTFLTDLMRAGMKSDLAARDFSAVELADAHLAAMERAGDKADPLAMHINGVFTVPASLAGLPAMSVSARLSSEGLPLGLQITGLPLDEAGVLDAGLAIERAADFRARP